MKFEQVITIRFLVLTALNLALVCAQCKSARFYLSLNDDALWAATAGGNKIGRGAQCFIFFISRRNTCPLQVFVATQGPDEKRAWPRDVFGESSNCVRAPDWTNGPVRCLVDQGQYNLPRDISSMMCSATGRNNAIFTMRHAIRNGQCMLPFCGGPPFPPASMTPSPAPCTDAKFYLDRTDDELWGAITSGKKIGGGSKCFVEFNGEQNCPLKLHVATTGGDGNRGWPRDVFGCGTGCVRAYDWKDGEFHCLVGADGYNLPGSVSETFCTENGRNNSIATMRHAIRNGQCRLPRCPGSPAMPTPSMTATPSPVDCAGARYYLERTDDELWDAITFGKKIGGGSKCFIEFNGERYCPLKLHVATKGGDGNRGWPRDVFGCGTGCVRAYDWKDGEYHCLVGSDGYNLPGSVSETFCTENGRNNSIATMRHAIRNGQCRLPRCPGSPAMPTPSMTATPSPVDCAGARYYLERTDDELWDAITFGKKIGGGSKCFVEFNRERYCPLKLHVATTGGDGNRGWPRDVFGCGTGCVRAFDWKDGEYHCLVEADGYNLPGSVSETFCSENGRNNSIATMRHAIRNNQCNLPFCSGDSVAMVSSTPSPVRCQNRAFYMNLNDDELWAATILGNRIGTGLQCYIVFSLDGNCAITVLVATRGRSGDRVWPRNILGGGSGCVRAPDWKNGQRDCEVGRGEYSLPDDVSRQFCTNYGKSNAIATMRHAIGNGQCGLLTSCPVTPTLASAPLPLDGLIPEALKDGWNCVHWKSNSPCFASNSKYLLNVLKKCDSCLGSLSKPSDSAPIRRLGDLSSCPRCSTAIAATPSCPKGSKSSIRKKAKGCKLVLGSGCWPEEPAMVLHSCDEDQDCVFFVKKNKAKIVCCAEEEACAARDTACKKRNKQRCTRHRTSQTSFRTKTQVISA